MGLLQTVLFAFACVLPGLRTLFDARVCSVHGRIMACYALIMSLCADAGLRERQWRCGFRAWRAGADFFAALLFALMAGNRPDPPIRHKPRRAGETPHSRQRAEMGH